MRYPTLEEVQKASQLQLARWLRFLPSPGLAAAGTERFETTFNRENEAMNLIMKRFNGWTPALSKAVGWKL